MKGLLLKDIFTLEKQMRAPLIMILFVALIPVANISNFIIMYAIIIPISSFGYDEHAKWDRLMRMMPIQERTIILSKYVLGYGFLGLISLIMLIAQFGYHAFGYRDLTLASFPVFLLNNLPMFLLALTGYAILMPFVFKLGMEKGRLVFGAVFAVFIFLTIPFSFIQIISDGLFISSWFIWLLLVVAAVVNISSIKLSQRFYSRNTNS
ncbi:ABC-2 family transporter protein [Halolactibacillus halophilus]|uniref:ABC-2 family transporter protein n=1 Tax=Halolactibacillus halophilus TaxID=306540 RepID=A0A1I5SR75_9BACI|nr:ABC-2 transporter permease [Halolactibacillus halophilus]GEM02672.1 membrane protein [Halolactibacillus halophilus]SFP73294.1 ABC-2 family transporter protein [Halolactibacillus halophilus]